MLERENRELLNKSGSQSTIKRNYDGCHQDLLLSLSHRLSIVENGLNSKMERNQCMLILENKSSQYQLGKVVEQLSIKLENYEKIVGLKLAEHEKINTDKLDKLRQKLRVRKKERVTRRVSGSQQKNISVNKCQQVHNEQNQSLITILVDEIVSLKQSNEQIERNLQQRNKVALNLNNEVCDKIVNLQKEIENCLKYGKKCEKGCGLEESSRCWSNLDEKQSKMKESGTNFQRTSLSKQSCGGESHQIAHLMRMFQSMQKQISNKINIKDILPIIKKNTQPLSQLIEQVKNYTEEAIESTKKILINQSEINQELCLVSKVGWWQSFESREGFAVWNKQIVNLVPQNFSCQKESNMINIAEQGNYVIKVLSSTGEIPQSVIVGGEEMELSGETLIKVEKNTGIQVPLCSGEVVVCIHKI